MKDADKEEAIVAVTDLVEAAASSTPVVAPLLSLLRVAHKRRENRRLNILFSVAIDCEEPTKSATQAETVRAFTESDEDVLSIVRRALEEDDEEKVWFYGALLRSFALGEVESKDERLRMLRFTSTIVGDDLQTLTAFASAAIGARERGEGWQKMARIGIEHPIIQALKIVGLNDPRWGREVEVNPPERSPFYRLLRIADVANRSKKRLIRSE